MDTFCSTIVFPVLDKLGLNYNREVEEDITLIVCPAYQIYIYIEHEEDQNIFICNHKYTNDVMMYDKMKRQKVKQIPYGYIFDYHEGRNRPDIVSEIQDSLELYLKKILGITDDKAISTDLTTIFEMMHNRVTLLEQKLM